MPPEKVKVLLIGDSRGQEDLILLQHAVQELMQRSRSERIECKFTSASSSPDVISSRIATYRPHVVAFQYNRGNELDIATVAMSRVINPRGAKVIFLEEHPAPHYLRFNGLELKGGSLS